MVVAQGLKVYSMSPKIVRVCLVQVALLEGRTNNPATIASTFEVRLKPAARTIDKDTLRLSELCQPRKKHTERKICKALQTTPNTIVCARHKSQVPKLLVVRIADVRQTLARKDS